MTIATSWSVEHDMVVRRFGSGPELVWIHGLGEQSSSFEPVASRIEGFTHVLVDMPGYGRSQWIVESLDETANRLVRWLDGSSPLLAGHSMGGVLGQLVAERDRIRGLIDIDGNLTRGDCSYSAQALAYSADDFAAGGFETMCDEIYKRGIADPALRGYYAAMRMTSPHVFHLHATDLVAISEGETLVPRLAKLEVPVLFIAGDIDGGICARSRALLDQHSVKWTTIEGTGHWPFVDEPIAFAEAVTRFVAAL